MGYCLRVSPPPTPLDQLYREIGSALDAKLYWLAITSSLSLPGVCAALERADHWSGQNEYKDFYGRYLAKRFIYMTADQCYSLRCGVVHKATSGAAVKGQPYQRILFTLPEAGGNMLHGCVMNGVLQFDAIQFCRDMIAASKEWYRDNRESEIVRANAEQVFQYRPNGLAPYILGMPLIA